MGAAGHPSQGHTGTIRLRHLLILLRGQLWLVPLLFSAAGIALAFAVMAYGGPLLASLSDGDGKLWWLYSGDAGTARGLLSSLLSGLMTMISLIVSVTFVILTLAANQLGPRLVPTFLSDRQIQGVLGLFLGTILYVLVVLRSINDTLGDDGAPHVAITIAVLLTVFCLFALLFYVHKVARSTVADTIIDVVAGDLAHNIRAILPEPGTGAPPRPAALPGRPVQRIALGRSGTIQVVDYDRLVDLGRRRDAAFAVQVRAGHFVLSRGVHVIVHAASPLAEDDVAEVRHAFMLGTERSPAQDLEYGVRQLVEIALRALSPGINDPFTAIAVIDRLGAALEEVGRRDPVPAMLRDSGGIVRVLADRSTMEGLVGAAFDPIRQAASSVPSVLIRLADLLGQLGAALARPDATAALTRQIDKLEETARAAVLADCDRADVLARIAQAREGFAPASGPSTGSGRAPLPDLAS